VDPRSPDLVLNVPQELELSSVADHIELPLARAERADLEFPWTLTMEVMKTKETDGRSVLLSSDLVEVCANYDCDKQVDIKDDQGKKIGEKTVHHTGLGLVRCSGARLGLGSPAESHKVGSVSWSFDQKLELNKWTRVTVTGSRGASAVYLDGKKIGGSNNQMVCPLRTIGSAYGQSFVGKIRNLKVVNRLLTDEEIAQPTK
jgi:hexosaminidase